MSVEVLGTQLRFADPWLLGLLLLIPLGLALRARGSGGVLFSSVGLLPLRPPALRERLGWIVPVLRVGGLVLLVAALARPQTIVATELEAEGIDIAVVLDISGSMDEPGFGGAAKIDAAKGAVHDFLDGLGSDRVGLVVFAGDALVLSPLSLDHAAVQRLVEPLHTGADLVAGGTAIGTGLATGLNVLRGSTAASKVAVVLTDGENNAGEVLPLDAAEAARVLGVRIYSIGAVSTVEAISGAIPVNEELMERMAGATGGRYFRAEDEQAIRQIYEEIATLERSRVGTRSEFAAYEDAMLPLLLLGAALLALELLLRATALRRSP